MHELKAGAYKHYKGGLYLVIGKATHADTGELLVVYVPLAVTGGTGIMVRPYDTFTENITVKNMTVPRYMYIGEEVAPAVATWYDPLSGYRGADRVDC